MTEYVSYITYGRGFEHRCLCDEYGISDADAKRICEEEWHDITDRESRYQAVRRMVGRAKRGL